MLRPEDADAGRVHQAVYPTATAEEFRGWIDSAGGTSHDGVLGRVGGRHHSAEVLHVTSLHARHPPAVGACPRARGPSPPPSRDSRALSKG